MAFVPPRTLPEWKAYVAGLSAERLAAKAKAANSLIFVRTLQDEGYSADQIQSIFVYFAQRLAQIRQPFPDGLYDLESLSREQPPV